MSNENYTTETYVIGCYYKHPEEQKDQKDLYVYSERLEMVTSCHTGDFYLRKGYDTRCSFHYSQDGAYERLEQFREDKAILEIRNRKPAIEVPAEQLGVFKLNISAEAMPAQQVKADKNKII